MYKWYFHSRFFNIALLGILFTQISNNASAAPLVITPTTVSPGDQVTVSGPGVQPGAKILVWGGSSLLSSVVLTGYSWDVAISGGYAFVAAGSAGMHVIDITEPENPMIVANVVINGSAENINISGNYAYVGSGSSNLTVIDISNPVSPVLMSTVDPVKSTDITFTTPFAYTALGQTEQKQASLESLESLVIYAPLNDRVRGRVGTEVEVLVGSVNLTLAEVSSGSLLIPSENYTVENNFGSNGATMVFQGTVTDGALIVGSRDVFKPLLNFGSESAVIGFWVDDISENLTTTIISAGPSGSQATNRGGWSVYTGVGRIWFVMSRFNHPSLSNCRVISIAGAGTVPLISDGKRHFVTVVYNTQAEEMYTYVDGVKGGIRDMQGCSADSDGDDAGTQPGQDLDWFTIGEAGQSTGRSFFNGSVQDLFIFKPTAIPMNMDEIVNEWYTLGIPGQKAASAF